MSYLNNELYLQILRTRDTVGLTHHVPQEREDTMNDKQLHDVLAGVALILTLVTTFVVCGFLEAVL